MSEADSSTVSALVDIMKSTAYPTEVRLGAIEGLGLAGGQLARKALLEVAKSTAYSTPMRAAAAAALGRATAR